MGPTPDRIATRLPLGSLTWPEVAASAAESILAVPLGSTSVRLGAAEPGETGPLADLIGELRRTGVAAVSANGVLGDPAGASADEGERLLEQLADLGASVEAWSG